MNPKIVDLKEVYTFEWDTLYIFTDYTGPESMSETIGLDCHCRYVEEFEEQYIFVKDNSLVSKSVGECDGYHIDAKIRISLEGEQKIASDQSKFLIRGGPSSFDLIQLEE